MHFLQHGVDGLIGSIDCMHLYWKKCPMAWLALYGRKEKAPTIALEAFADYNTYIWHSAFGYPGSNNDINILEQSPLLAMWLDGSFHRDLDFEFTINGQQFKQLFLLADGIYPNMSRFVKTYGVPIASSNNTTLLGRNPSAMGSAPGST
jgi:Plant transposon protein